MKVSNTSMRLKQLMETRRMKQVDILDKVEPSQFKLSISIDSPKNKIKTPLTVKVRG